MRGSRAVMIALFLGGLTACDESFWPWGSTGTYDLRAVNGRSIPAPVFERVGNNAWAVHVIGGELRLRGDGSFRLDVDYVETEPDAEIRYATSIAGRWDREHEMITLEYVDPGTGRWRSTGAVPRRGSLEFSLPAAGLGTGMRVLFER